MNIHRMRSGGRLGTCLGLICALSSCATTPDASVGSKPCDVVATTAVGAVIGAVVGAVTTPERQRNGGRQTANAGKGAAAGGALAGFGCLLVNVTSRQTATANDVDGQMRRRNGGRMPPLPTVVSYQVAVTPAAVLPPGTPIEVRSTVEVASGAQEPVRDLHESLVLVDPEGAQYPLSEKDVGASSSRAGRYENSFRFSIPQQVSGGSYRALTRLQVNGRIAAERVQLIQVAAGPS